jgi:hypothetical protein
MLNFNPGDARRSRCSPRWLRGSRTSSRPGTWHGRRSRDDEHVRTRNGEDSTRLAGEHVGQNGSLYGRSFTRS